MAVTMLGYTFQWPVNFGVSFSQNLSIAGFDFGSQMAHPSQPPIEVTSASAPLPPDSKAVVDVDFINR